jgi:hypothetical protein
MRTEDDRAGRLLDAQANAVALFDEVAARGIITAGLGEQAVSDQIRDLANEMFGKTRHWHKRIVRSGPHTLFPYRENPPDRVIEADDIAFADFGPIFEEFEADLGRTYVLGGDPVKHRLAGEAGWSLGGKHAGHLVGEFPHETIDGARIESYIAPGNTTPMRRTDKAGRVCHWILEIHLTEPERGFGGFYEQLLDLG